MNYKRLLERQERRHKLAQEKKQERKINKKRAPKWLENLYTATFIFEMLNIPLIFLCTLLLGWQLIPVTVLLLFITLLVVAEFARRYLRKVYKVK